MNSPVVAKHELLTIQIVGIEFRKGVSAALSSHHHTTTPDTYANQTNHNYIPPTKQERNICVSCCFVLHYPFVDATSRRLSTFPLSPIVYPCHLSCVLPSLQCNPNNPTTPNTPLLLPNPLNPPSPSPKPPTAVPHPPKPRFTMTSIGMKCTR